MICAEIAKKCERLAHAHVSLIDETNVSFVDECGGLKCVAFALAAHVTTREPVQFVVDQRIQLVERGLIPFAPLGE